MNEVPLHAWTGQMDLEEASAAAGRWVNPSGDSTFRRPLQGHLDHKNCLTIGPYNRDVPRVLG